MQGQGYIYIYKDQSFASCTVLWYIASITRELPELHAMTLQLVVDRSIYGSVHIGGTPLTDFWAAFVYDTLRWSSQEHARTDFRNIPTRF
jgi:hypothetical protein